MGERTSTSEYAPAHRDDFVEAIGSLACEGECNLQACMADRHHLIFGTDLTDAEKLLKSHPDFIVPQVCRDKHEKFHKRYDRSEPLSTEFVIGHMLASPVNMSTTRKKKLRGLM